MSDVEVSEEDGKDSEELDEITVRDPPKVGKPKHPIWSDAFDEPDAHSIQNPNTTTCKHCKQPVLHHHKTICVERHLRKCKQFKKVMLDTTISDLPGWWKNGIQGAPQKSKTAALTSSKINGMPKANLQKSIKSFSIPHFTAVEQKRFNREIAMHFYCTGTSFVRVEDPHLRRAIELARPNAKLPSRKQIADDNKGRLPQECYESVKNDVKKHLSGHSQWTICMLD